MRTIRVTLPLGVEPQDVTNHFGKGGPGGAHVHGQIGYDKDGNQTDNGVLELYAEEKETITQADVEARVAAIEANPTDPTLPSVKAAAERAKPTLEQRVTALEAIVRP